MSVPPCERCGKAPKLCVCATVTPIATRHHVLLLQHPQEPDVDLGTARLAHVALPNSTLRVGLSWRNLEAALGRPAVPAKWAVLYLGSVHGTQSRRRPPTSGGQRPEGPPEGLLARTGPRSSDPREPPAPTGTGPLQLVSKKGEPLADARAVLPTIEGLVVLDGTWSQAKALWWRNAWLLKLRRAVLVPARPSLYGRLRKEPRPDALSTIESVGLALTGLGEPVAVEEGLRDVFSRMLDAYRERDRRAPS